MHTQIHRCFVFENLYTKQTSCRSAEPGQPWGFAGSHLHSQPQVVQPWPQAGTPDIGAGCHQHSLSAGSRGVPAGDAEGVAQERRNRTHLEGAGEGTQEHSSG